jgi:hypothetical protein
VIAARAETFPREFAELDARIPRPRERLKAGDPNLTPMSCKSPSIAGFVGSVEKSVPNI